MSMAQERKYRNLPDLDTSPDIYESSETANNKSEDADSQRSPSDSDPSTDSDTATSAADDEPVKKTSRISRHGLSTSHARSQFTDARVDARDVDFSDRIADGRKSYRVPGKKTSRRRRIRRDGNKYIDEYGFESDEEEETFNERIARLKREIEEVKAEGEKRSKEDADGAQSEPSAAESAAELSNMITALQSQIRATRPPAVTLAVQNGRPSAPQGITRPTPEPLAIPPPDLERILSKAAAFESRLTLMENALGLSNTASVQPKAPPPPKNVLLTLTKLEAQITTLTSTTLPSLDSMSSHIHRLTEDANRLVEVRAAARQAREPGSPSANNNAGTTREPIPPGIDAQTEAKISALHDSLASMSQLSPLLPAVLDRLKSLRVLHADAATISERFAEAERLQARLGGELGRWKAALEGMQGKIQEVREVEDGNRTAVEGWVGNLETRLGKLET